MLCSLLRKMCSPTSASTLPEQYFNKAANMSSASSINSISPPSPPPSPTMSMASINSDISEQPRKIKVMIIDDNAINLTILSRLLNKHFADTIQLTSVMDSGVSALDQLSKDQVDLILMDIDMPVLSGVQTTTAIRSSDNHDILVQNKNVPIIAVTTSDAAEQRELYRQVGMADCVSKPIALPKLRMAIESAMKTIPALSTG